MPAYVRRTVAEFIEDDAKAIIGSLQQAYANDGFASQYTQQTRAWIEVVPKLRNTFSQLVAVRTDAAAWTILLEYPLYGSYPKSVIRLRQAAAAGHSSDRWLR